jgi:hypothetical protein
VFALDVSLLITSDHGGWGNLFRVMISINPVSAGQKTMTGEVDIDPATLQLALNRLAKKINWNSFLSFNH